AIENARMYARIKASEEKLRVQVGVLRRDLARRDRFAEMIGSGPAMAEVFRLMESAAASPISVLIEGETGTGKELVARGIHRAGERAEGPFIAVNCAALPETLLESELFGHRRGAFTGATQDRRGLFGAGAAGVHGMRISGSEPGGMALLVRFGWPGNVRELENEIERAAALARDGDAIAPGQLSSKVAAALERAAGSSEQPSTTAASTN